MADYSSNLLINPYATEAISVGWTAYENVGIISDGYSGKAFRFSSPAYLEQTIPVETFGETTKGLQLSCRARFNNSGPYMYSEIVLYLKLQVNTVDSVRSYFLPCHIMLENGLTGWSLFEKSFTEYLTDVTSVTFRAYTTDPRVIVDLDNISVALDITKSDSEQAYDDSIVYTDEELGLHLNDILNAHLTEEQKDGLTGYTPRLKTIKLGLENDVAIANRNLYSNNNPAVLFEVFRENAPIITPQYWTEILVHTAESVTATSVAIEHTTSGPGKVYVAYVSNGTLTVRAAQFAFPLSDMIWEDITSIVDVIDCALDFDGSFVSVLQNTNEFITDELPYLAYTTLTGQLMVGIVGGPYTSLTANNVLSVDLIRGVASRYKDVDQGLLAIYALPGGVYFRQLINGVWQDQQTVSIAPPNIVKLNAERTFDWRIVLQVQDVDGKLYEVFSEPYISGNINVEFLTAKVTDMTVSVTEINYADYKNADEYITAAASMEVWAKSTTSPYMVSAWNIPTSMYNEATEEYYDDYGYYVVLKWSDAVFDFEANLDKLKMLDAYGMSWYPQEITRDELHNRLIMRFTNFNNAVSPITLSYTPGTLSSGIVTVDADSIQFSATGLVPYYVPAPEFVSAWNDGNQTVYVEFNMPIVSILAQTGFNVYAQEPLMVPGDTEQTSYTVVDVVHAPPYLNYTDALDGSMVDTGLVMGNITLAEDF